MIDFIIVLLPVQLLLLGVLGASDNNANFLLMMLFAVYNVVLLATTHNGQTIGKIISKTAVRDNEGIKSTLMHIGLRELTKLIYFIPILGWAVGLLSVFLIFLKGRAVHDYIAETNVFFLWELRENKNDEA
jgi:uncharacterized RDD family membrane protein YckC